MSELKVIRRRGRPRLSDIEGGFDESHNKEISHQKLIAKHEMKKNLKSRADLAAGDFEFVKFFPVPKLADLYPSMPWKWHVDKFYPHAEGGALYIDEPSTIAECCSLQCKQKFMLENGFRYIVLDPTKTQYDDLMELEKCGQQQPTQSLN